jgi:hypothetical protein
MKEETVLTVKSNQLTQCSIKLQNPAIYSNKFFPSESAAKIIVKVMEQKPRSQDHTKKHALLVRV